MRALRKRPRMSSQAALTRMWQEEDSDRVRTHAAPHAQEQPDEAKEVSLREAIGHVLRDLRTRDHKTLREVSERPGCLWGTFPKWSAARRRPVPNCCRPSRSPWGCPQPRCFAWWLTISILWLPDSNVRLTPGDCSPGVFSCLYMDSSLCTLGHVQEREFWQLLEEVLGRSYGRALAHDRCLIVLAA